MQLYPKILKRLLQRTDGAAENATAAGGVMVKDVSPVALACLVLSITACGGGGGGSGFVGTNGPPPVDNSVCGDGLCTVDEDGASCPGDCCPDSMVGACEAFANCGGFSDPQEVRISDEVNYSFAYDGNIISRSARLFAPKAGTQTATCPVVVVLPGGCGDKESAEWAGPLIASRGYVVLVAEVQAAEVSGGLGPENAQICSAAAQGAMDFIQSPANPYLSDSDTDRIGGAGYSLGARSWVKTQDVDDRLGAIVAWDNLAISEDGDLGSPACRNEPGVIRQPRVPAMGQASDLTCLNEPARQGRNTDAKKNGFLHWRQAGVPSMELVFRDTPHSAWSGRESGLHLAFSYYTTNWFDRFLKGDASATQRLLSREVPIDASSTLPVEELLSDEWRSAVYLDGYDCPDLLDCIQY